MIRRILSLMLTPMMLIVFLSVTAAAGTMSAKSEYAWVLVETIDFENAEKWAVSDAHESYKVSHSYSRGSYSASVTYEGDDPYKEGKKGTLGLRAVFSGVPEIIYPDKPVSLNLSFSITENSVVKLSFSGSAVADFDQWDVAPGGVTGRAQYFANANGKDSFTLDVNGNPSSYSETLTATLGTGSEGSRIALRTRFSMNVAMGTNYVYEWKQVGASGVQPTVTESQASSTTPSTGKQKPPTPTPVSSSICRFGDLYGEVNVLSAEDWEAGNDDAWVFADFDTPLKHGDRIRTLRRSGAIISFSDMSTYVMKEDTTIVLDIKSDNQSKIGLVAGNVWTNLKKMVTGGSLEIEMGQAVAGIKGTTLICEEIDGVSVVKVIEGTVEFTSKVSGEMVQVSNGKMVTATTDGLGDVTTFDIDTELETWNEKTQQLTAEALARSKGGLNNNVFILIILVVLVLAAVLVVILLKRNKSEPTLSPSYPQGPVCQNTPISNDKAYNSSTTKFCGNCGSSILTDSKFCAKCGQYLES